MPATNLELKFKKEIRKIYILYFYTYMYTHKYTVTYNYAQLHTYMLTESK
jgi:hypothetical protein